MGHYCFDHLNIGVKDHMQPACLVIYDYAHEEKCGICGDKAIWMTVTNAKPEGYA